MRAAYLADEADIVTALMQASAVSADERAAIEKESATLIRAVRKHGTAGLMEQFLAEYGLSNQEGIALMCLAEALLRVPDDSTVDELISDKISPGEWGQHLGRSASSFVNASTWALLITGKVLAPMPGKGVATTIRSMMKSMGEPVVREAVASAMRMLGKQFVLGRTIKEAIKEGQKARDKGYSYSYDMLGEAARTDADAQKYLDAYRSAIAALAPHCKADTVRDNPGISVKLSALHPRYEYSQRDRVMQELLPRVRDMMRQAARANMGFNIDAEEADRLDLSLDLIEALLEDESTVSWNGLGIVVQAYGLRARKVLDWLYALAKKHNRQIMVRLVKGAYWDSEIKRAQEMGLKGFPVFTRKHHSDISYTVCAEKLLAMTDHIYPQFATHNAHSIATVKHLAQGQEGTYEFQRLHGMGEILHDQLIKSEGVRSRIYAPVGSHKDLLAYLVRRLLENGANNSFVNQIVDTSLDADFIATCPFKQVAAQKTYGANKRIAPPSDLFAPRKNSIGYDWTEPGIAAQLEKAVSQKLGDDIIANRDIKTSSSTEKTPIYNPAETDKRIGYATETSTEDAIQAVMHLQQGFADWSGRRPSNRADILDKAADLYETHSERLMAFAVQEAGKTIPDAIAELREAIDFLRYYADQARNGPGQTSAQARGIFVCISPWNFPLAIFTGQVAAALVTGNCVAAKPAEQTPLIAAEAIHLLHKAGVPKQALALVPGDGAVAGAALTNHPDIAGVCFTGSTETAQIINSSIAGIGDGDIPLIAETGGLNAMIVDSTALAEQSVNDIIASAFQSAGQRCSALRMLYVQEDIADDFTAMLKGTMDELKLGDPARLSTDIGPVIDPDARQTILDHIETARNQGRILKELKAPRKGCFVAPTLIEVSGIEMLEREVFGPVLHLARFKAAELDTVLDDINATGYGLTFGLHTRIDSRVQHVVERINAGNIYVNRNQIGAIVGSQPFGGENLSGTGPKAGGPFYLPRFTQSVDPAAQTDSGPTDHQTSIADTMHDPAALTEGLQQQISALSSHDWVQEENPVDLLRELMRTAGTHLDPILNNTVAIRQWRQNMPGPTGESNRMSLHPRGTVLCGGTDLRIVEAHVAQALALGNAVVIVLPDAPHYFSTLLESGLPVLCIDGVIGPEFVRDMKDIDAVAIASNGADFRPIRKALAERRGRILPLITETIAPTRFMVERHLCVDTTAAGGNASLLAASQD